MTVIFPSIIEAIVIKYSVICNFEKKIILFSSLFKSWGFEMPVLGSLESPQNNIAITGEVSLIILNLSLTK